MCVPLLCISFWVLIRILSHYYITIDKCSVLIIVDVEETDSLMEGEIFGPLLPIVNINSVDEAIAFINKR